MNSKHISKLMSLALRHQPEELGLNPDNGGWVQVTDLIDGLIRKGIALDQTGLEELVRNNDKKRFVISDDGTAIRANQGHSFKVDLGLLPQVPPEILYHGTVEKFLPSIRQKGLQKMNRQHLHLSANKDTAIVVAERRGGPVLLEIEALKMHQQGFKFYLSENNVWLTDEVPVEYIRNL